MHKTTVETALRLAALRNNEYFSGLNDNTLELFSQGMQLHRYSGGEIVCWQGENCPGLFTIYKGSVKLFRISPKGRELIIRVLEEGASFNEVPVFDMGENAVNVAALEESEIWVVDRDVIRRALEENPDFARALILKLSQNLRMLVNLVEELSFHQVTNRLARLIIQLPPEQLQGKTSQRITQDQLAARLGTVREVVARSLRELERSGAIRVRRRQIQVVNRDLLAAWTHETGAE